LKVIYPYITSEKRRFAVFYVLFPTILFAALWSYKNKSKPIKKYLSEVIENHEFHEFHELEYMKKG